MRGAALRFGRSRSVVAAAAGALPLVLCACTSTAPAVPRPSPGVGVGAALFGDCGDRLGVLAAQLPTARAGRVEFGCAVVSVPLDHERPDGATIALAVARARSVVQHDRIGSLLLNPGGPGQSGLSFLPYWAGSFPDELLDRFDLVSFDPRGVGRSAPIRCRELPEPEADPLPDPTTEAGYRQALHLAREQSDACLAALGDRSRSFDTDATARDLDLLRSAVGDRSLTYLGFSYGAALGGHYAHLFPDRVRALALDAPGDPYLPYRTLVDTQMTGLEDQFSRYAAACPQRPSCASIGDAAALLDRVVARARAVPIRSGRPSGDPPATWDDVLRAVTGLLYAPQRWGQLDDALDQAERGDSGSLYDELDALRGRDPQDSDPYDADDALQVIHCNDSPVSAAPPTRSQTRQMLARHPTFGGLGALQLFTCLYWPAPSHPLEPPTAPTAPGILVVGSAHDPVTPYSGARAFTEALGGPAVLLTHAGGGHTAFGASDCITEQVVRYLVDRVLPQPGTRCT